MSFPHRHLLGIEPVPWVWIRFSSANFMTREYILIMITEWCLRKCNDSSYLLILKKKNRLKK